MLTIQRWRKANNLPAQGRMKQEKPEAPPEPAPWDRIRQLLDLVRSSDSWEARDRMSQLAGQWLQDWARDELAKNRDTDGPSA